MSAGPRLVALTCSLGILGCAFEDDTAGPAPSPACAGSSSDCLGSLAGSYSGSLSSTATEDFRLLLQSDGVVRGSVTRLGLVESLRGSVTEDGVITATGSAGAELNGAVTEAGHITGTYDAAPAATRDFIAQRVGPAFPPESGRQRGEGSRCERLARLSFECAVDLSVDYCTEPEGIDVCYAECLLGATCEELSDPSGGLGQLICQGACESRTAEPPSSRNE